MALTKEVKQELIGKHGRERDGYAAPRRCRSRCSRSGSTTSPSTCGRTRRITTPGAGCLKLVGRRRRFLTYMQKHDLEGYRALIKELGLRR